MVPSIPDERIRRVGNPRTVRRRSSIGHLPMASCFGTSVGGDEVVGSVDLRR